MEEEGKSEESPLSLFMFADANYGLTTSHRDGAVPFHRAYATNGADGNTANGFQFEWLGIDATYSQGEVGATASLRFGDAVPIFFGDQGPNGIDNLLQGYLTWAPSENVTLDLGQFGTIFGAEVGESWNNLNYTRGGLYYAMQPFWHTGLRANFALDPKFALNAMLVNGVNNSFDGDDAPTVALQAAITPTDEFALYIGGLQALDPTKNSGYSGTDGFDTFIDVVATLNVGDFSAVFNGDFNIDAGTDKDSDDDTKFFGLSLALGYSFTDHFGIAGRYEFLSDPDGALWTTASGAALDKTKVHTVTGTFDIKPLDTSNLVIRWDNRFEKSDQDIYANLENEDTDKWFASVLGVVVKMDE